MLGATTLDDNDNDNAPDAILAPAEPAEAADVIPFGAAEPTPDGEPVELHDGDHDPGPAAAPPEDAEAEADVEEQLIRIVMPLVFDAMDDSAKHYDAPATPEAQLGSATAIARALLVQRWAWPEQGDRLDRLADLIAQGVCAAEEAPDVERPEPSPEPESEDAPAPPTVAEVVRAVRMGKEEIARAVAALPTATAEEEAGILLRVEAMRDQVAELESLLPDRPAFAADEEQDPEPNIAKQDQNRTKTGPKKAPVFSMALLAVAVVAFLAALALIAHHRGRNSRGE